MSSCPSKVAAAQDAADRVHPCLQVLFLDPCHQGSAFALSRRLSTPWRASHALLDKVRLYLGFRSMILNKWYDASDKLLAAGMTRARQIEEIFWKTCQMVVVATPSLKVKDADGQLLKTEEIEAVLSKSSQSVEVRAHF